MYFLCLVHAAGLVALVASSPMPQQGEDASQSRIAIDYIIKPPIPDDEKPCPTCRFTVLGEAFSIEDFCRPECACNCLASGCLYVNVSRQLYDPYAFLCLPNSVFLPQPESDEGLYKCIKHQVETGNFQNTDVMTGYGSCIGVRKLLHVESRDRLACAFYSSANSNKSAVNTLLSIELIARESVGERHVTIPYSTNRISYIGVVALSRLSFLFVHISPSVVGPRGTGVSSVLLYKSGSSHGDRYMRALIHSMRAKMLASL